MKPEASWLLILDLPRGNQGDTPHIDLSPLLTPPSNLGRDENLDDAA